MSSSTEKKCFRTPPPPRTHRETGEKSMLVSCSGVLFWLCYACLVQGSMLSTQDAPLQAVTLPKNNTETLSSISSTSGLRLWMNFFSSTECSARRRKSKHLRTFLSVIDTIWRLTRSFVVFSRKARLVYTRLQWTRLSCVPFCYSLRLGFSRWASDYYVTRDLSFCDLMLDTRVRTAACNWFRATAFWRRSLLTRKRENR